jgi:hypothetical protein
MSTKLKNEWLFLKAFEEFDTGAVLVAVSSSAQGSAIETFRSVYDQRRLWQRYTPNYTPNQRYDRCM